MIVVFSIYFICLPSLPQMGLVETDGGSYMIQPVGGGGLGEDNPHIMFNINDWSLLSDEHKHSVDSKCELCALLCNIINVLHDKKTVSYHL